MKRGRALFLVVASILGLALGALGAGEDEDARLLRMKSWAACLEAGTQAYQQHHFAEGEALLARAVAEAESFGPQDPRVAESLTALADCYRMQRKYEEAEACCLRALRIEEKRLGSDDPELVLVLSKLGQVLRDQRRFEEGEEPYRRALALQEQVLRAQEETLGPDHLDLIETLEVLGDISGAMAGPWEEEPYRKRQLEICERALAQREREFGPEHPVVAEALVARAEVLRGPDAREEAARLYEQALAIRGKELGPDHPELADMLEKLGDLYATRGKHAEALPFYQRTLAIRENAAAVDYAGLEAALGRVADVYLQLGIYRQEKAAFRRRIELKEHFLARQEEELGCEHAAVAFRVEGLAKLYQIAGSRADLGKAAALYQRALRTKERWLGREHQGLARTLSDLAWVYFHQREYGEAAPLLTRAVAIREKAAGQEYPEVSDLLRRLADVCSAQGKGVEAAEARRRAREAKLKKQIAFAQEHPDPDSPMSADPVIELARLYRSEGRLAEARARCEQALGMKEEQLGPEHPDLVGILDALAEMAYAQGKAEEGKAYHERAQAIHQAGLRGTGEATVGLMEELGTSEGRARARALVIEAQEALRIAGGYGVKRPGSPESKADDRLVELRRELVAMGQAAVMALLDAPEDDRGRQIGDWQRETIRRIGSRAIPALAAALRDPRDDVRETALRCLVDMDDPSAARAIAEALAEPDSPIREHLGERPFYLRKGLAEDRRMVDVLLGVWGTKGGVAGQRPRIPDTREARETLLEIIGEWEAKTEEAERTIREAARVRRSLIRPLYELGGEAAIEQLVREMESRQEEVRGSAMYWLKQMDDSAAEPVARLLYHNDPEVRRAALSVLRRVGVPEESYPEVFSQVYESEVRGAALGILPRLNPEKVVPWLLDELARMPPVPDESIQKQRVELVRTLGRVGDARATEPLMAILRDREEPAELRRAAFGGLAWLDAPGVAEAATDILGDPEQVRIVMDRYSRELHVVVEDPVAFYLGVLASHPDPHARNDAIWALGRLHDPRAVEPIVRVLQGEPAEAEETRVNLRGSAAWALGEIGDSRAVPALLEFASRRTREEGRFPWWAVEALGKIGDERAREPLRRMLGEAEPGSYDEYYLAVALGNLGEGSVIPVLKERMKNSGHGDGLPPGCPHYEQAEQAAQALARIGEEAVPVLLDALDWQYEHTADYAALALGEIGDVRALGPLIGLLDRRSYRTRHHAAVALGELGDPAAITHLWGATRDPSAYVRVGAAEALWRLGEVESLSVMTEVLRDGGEDWEREEVVAALGRIGGAQVIRALEEALSDAAFQVRWAARKALRGLEEQ